MIGPVDHSIITKLIEKLDTGQPKGNALKKLLIRSRLESHFYETYKTYLPIGKLTVEQLDKITGYSEKYIEKQNKAIESSPLPKRAIKNALSGLKFAKMESAFVKNIMLLNLDSDAGNKKWYTLDIKEMSYNSTVTPIYKNLDDLYGFQLANSKEAMAKFFEDALIGYSIAHCESFLKKVKSEIKSNDNSKLPPKRVLISIKECFIEKDGPKCFEKVVQKLSQRLEIVNDHLVIKSLERRIKVGTLLAEVSGLYRFLVDEDLVMRDESLRDVFLTEFKLRSSLYNKKCFQPGKTSNNPKVDMWKGLYRSKKTH